MRSSKFTGPSAFYGGADNAVEGSQPGRHRAAIEDSHPAAPLPRCVALGLFPSLWPSDSSSTKQGKKNRADLCEVMNGVLSPALVPRAVIGVGFLKHLGSRSYVPDPVLSIGGQR